MLLLCSGCDYPEQGCYAFIMHWEETNVLPVTHVNSLLIKTGFMLNYFQTQTTFPTWTFYIAPGIIMEWAHYVVSFVLQLRQGSDR